MNILIPLKVYYNCSLFLSPDNNLHMLIGVQDDFKFVCVYHRYHAFFLLLSSVTLFGSATKLLKQFIRLKFYNLARMNLSLATTSTEK